MRLCATGEGAASVRDGAGTASVESGGVGSAMP